MTAPRCTACDKVVPLPPLICFDCVHGTKPGDILASTYYCDTQCQAADKTNHPKSCKVRRTLYRAGDILQATYHIWRELLFNTKITKIWRDPGSKELKFTEGTYDKTDGLYFPFPEEMVKNARDRASLLTFMSCEEGVACMHGLLDKLLKNIATTTTEEAKFYLKDGSEAVWCHDLQGKRRRVVQAHQAVAVEAIDGEAYIIDVSGAQYGRHDVVKHFDSYMNDFVSYVLLVTESGHILSEMEKLGTGKTSVGLPGQLDLRPFMLQYKMHSFLVKVISDWETANKIQLSKILEQDQLDWERSAASLLTKIEKELRSFVQRWKEKDITAKDLSSAQYGGPSAPRILPSGSNSLVWRRWRKYSQAKGIPFSGNGIVHLSI